MKETAKNSLEDRLSLLEHRVSLMEAGKKPVKPSETENLSCSATVSSLGVSVCSFKGEFSPTPTGW